ncbi:MAG: histidine kinase, partial [Bacteroidota bacterium]
MSRDSSHSQTFSHKQNNIHFQFTGISYQRSKKHTFYRYRLRNTESVDSSWIYTNDRNARYNDLAAGQYTFEAAARNRQGEWSTNPIRYHFQILPHFSQTLLFRLAVLLGLGGLINWLYQLRNKREKIQQAQRQRIATAELKTKQAELLTLRNQMNPHFIYNVLNSIQNFIVRQDVFRANEYLSNFSKLIRNSLRFSRLQYISIAEEIDFLENYLSLEKMRFPKLFSYEIELPEELSAHHWYLPALLIQPLVENAVKHAFKERKNDGEIHIQFHISIPGKLIQICVTDNGIGLHKSKEYRNSSTLHQSMGLDIIQQQIDIINDQIETQLASLNISDLSQK